METFLLVDDVEILDSCMSYSKKGADKIFITRGWVIGEVISEADRISEIELAQLESFNYE
jgi:hypothetical protein